jgi:PIN domain nuclease of toxin-antitoxin system
MGGGDVIVLLDTHTFIWLDGDPSRLSATATAILRDPLCTKLLSTVSVLEIVIKAGLGKLVLHKPMVDILKAQQANGLVILPVLLDHALAVATLPTPHKDPFDRVLVAQAVVEGADLLSKDPIFSQYPVRVIW